MNKKKIIALVTIYNPNIDLLIKNINHFINSVDKVILWENSPLNEENKKSIKEKCVCPEKIVYKENSTNEGVAKPLNYLMQCANQLGFEYALSMDQDSIWNDFDQFVNTAYQCFNDNVYAIGPTTVNSNYIGKNNITNSDIFIKKQDYIITSGTLYKLNNIKSCYFNERLFIDGVDEDFCFRNNSKGASCLITNAGTLLQQFGDTQLKHFFGKTTLVSNYSPTRYYYIVRNHLWLCKQYYIDDTAKKAIRHNYVFMPFVKTVLFEHDKAVKIKYMIEGVYDFHMNKFGKINSRKQLK